MQYKSRWLLGLALAGAFALGGCVVAPPRARVVAVVPVAHAVWVPAHWYRGAWVQGHWR